MAIFEKSFKKRKNHQKKCDFLAGNLD